MNSKTTYQKVEKAWPALEEGLSLIIELLGLIVVFMLFREIGEWITDDNFSPDILLSLVVLPAIYLFKDVSEIIEPIFVKVQLSKDEVIVETGIFTRSKDCLKLKNIENIEVVTTLMGRWFNYGTLNLYAYGSWVQIPNIADYQKHQEDIQNHIQKNNKNA